MEISQYLTVARRWWWTLVAATWIAALSAWIVASGAAPTYAATNRILVGPLGSADLDTIRAASALVETYAQVTTTQPIMQRVVDNLGLTITAEELADSVQTAADDLTRVLTISAEHGNAEAAAQIANELGAVIMAEAATDGVVRPEGEMRVIDPARADPVPVAPDVVLIVGLAAAAGFIAALALVVLIEHLSDTVKSRHDLPSLTSSPLLGVIATPTSFRPSATRPLVVEAYPDSRVASAYRTVGGRLTLTDQAEGVRSLVVLGTEPGPAIGEFAANVSAVLTRSGRRVALVDADEASSGITELFSVSERSGIANLLEPGTKVDAEAVAHVRVTRVPDMLLIPRGSVPFRLIDDERARQLLELARIGAQMTIVVASPPERSGSTLIWARSADATVVVIERDRTRRDDLRATVETLQVVGANLIGVVLVERKRSLFGRMQGGTAQPARVTARGR